MNPVIEAAISKVDEAKDNLKKVVRAYCADKSQPVADRWGAFVKSGIGEHKCWIQHFDSVNDDLFACDSAPMYYQKYETIEMNELVESLLDKPCNKYVKSIEAFMEECMDKNIASFELDW